MKEKLNSTGTNLEIQLELAGVAGQRQFLAAHLLDVVSHLRLRRTQIVSIERLRAAKMDPITASTVVEPQSWAASERQRSASVRAASSAVSRPANAAQRSFARLSCVCHSRKTR